MSGVQAGVVLVFMFNPLWVVKTRLALQGVDLQQKHKYTGPIGQFANVLYDRNDHTVSVQMHCSASLEKRACGAFTRDSDPPCSSHRTEPFRCIFLHRISLTIL